MNIISRIKHTTYSTISTDFKSELSTYFSVRNFTIVTCCYLLSYISLLLGDVYYADDNLRRYTGKITLAGSGRFVDETVITLWNFSRSLLDSSPLFQIYAILILSITSLSLLAIFSIRTGIFQLLTSTFVGIFPLYYANMVYKVDAPFMAMSILFGVLPFLYYQRSKLFYIGSFLSAMVILSTYQTALTSYLIVFVFVLCRDLIAGKKIDLKATLGGLLCFGAGIALYRFTLYEFVTITHIDSSIIPLDSFISGLMYNFNLLACDIKAVLGMTHVVIVGIIAVLFVWQRTRTAEIHAAKAFVVAILAVIIGFPLTGGLNIILAHYPANVRYYLLFSFFVGILAIWAADRAPHVTKVLFVLFAMYFFNFDNGMGNALKTKSEYDNMIIGHFVYDFKNIVGAKDYAIEDITGKCATYPAIFNIDNNPDGLMTQHSPLVKSIMDGMDYGIQQRIGTFLPLVKGPIQTGMGGQYQILLSKQDYDIYFDGIASYKVVFKFLSSH